MLAEVFVPRGAALSACGFPLVGGTYMSTRLCDFGPEGREVLLL